MKNTYTAKGLDYQGRHPQAAEAATEVGADDHPRRRPSAPPLERFDPALIVALLVASVALIGALALHVWRAAA